MARSEYTAYGNEDALFDEGRDEFRMAQTAFSRNWHQAAFEHYIKAIDANPSQDIVDDMFKNARGLRANTKNAFLVTSYYLAIAEFSDKEHQVLASLDNVLKAARVAASDKDMPDHASIGAVAVDVLLLAPEGGEGNVRRFDAASFLNQQILALEAQDRLSDGESAKAFVAQQIVRCAHRNIGKTPDYSDEILAGIFKGTVDRFFFGSPIERGRINPRQLRAWIGNSTDKPRLN